MSKHRPMERIVIEKGLPVPSKAQLEPAMLKMGIGDSFLVPTQAKQSLAHWTAKKLGLVIRTCKVNGEGFRVRRVRRKA